ncbi:MAG: hypothetical protein AUI14_09160 [Actinobacteria bacterium 13_2_20CM_2_71_6]|nr:MAG: hypothetical protein AUI14_09160 [Actinobacteria bacterium 13_2_20CM_2_71_6]
MPALVADRVAKIREMVGSGHALRAAALSPQQRDGLTAGMLAITPSGGIDLQLHATGPVSANQRQALTALGATVLGSSADFAPVPGADLPDVGLVHAVVPYDKVDAVAGLPWIAAVRPTVKPEVDAQIVSEGVPLHKADVAQSRGITGKGQKIGVISDGATHLADAVARGELPADTEVLAVGDGDEGTAMMEIIHDMAPGAKLSFHTVGDDLTGYVNAFHNLAAAGATMISEDLAFDDEPAFQQGLGATTAEQLARHGIWISSSAGNLGNRHAPRVRATGTGRTPDGVAGTYAHCPSVPRNTVNLRGTDNTYDVVIRAGGAIMPTLQWSEPRAIYPTVGQGGFTDLNLYLMTADGTDCLAASTNVQANGVGDTIEQLLYENTGTTAVPAKLVVDVAGTSSAARTPILDLRWRTARVTTTDPVDRAGSLNPDSNYLGFATSAGAVGANLSTDPATIALEVYSAAGPVQIGSSTVCPGHRAGPCKGVPGGGFRSFRGPAWAAADGVSVSGVGGFGSGVCPATNQGDCRFFGTSAAAPSAMGVAALVREQFGGHIHPVALTAIMSILAVRRDDPGFGAGVLRATW